MLNDTAFVITAWQRPGYLLQAFESWSGVPEFSQFRRAIVALGRSASFDRQMDVIRYVEKTYGWSLGVRVDSDKAAASPGMHRALGEAIDAAFNDQGVSFVFCSEEDVVVSDDVLRYVAWARGAAGPQVLVICAHNVGGTGWDWHTVLRDGKLVRVLRDPDEHASQVAVHALPYFNPWGWGVTRNAWQEVVRPQWDWDCDTGGPDDSGYDWNMATRIMPRGGWLALVPEAARSQNIGREAGVYSTPEIHPLQVALSFREQRGLVSYQLEEGIPGGTSRSS